MLELSLILGVFAVCVACVPLGFAKLTPLLVPSKKFRPPLKPLSLSTNSPASTQPNTQSGLLEGNQRIHSDTKATFARLPRRAPTKSRMVEIVRIVHETPDTISLYLSSCSRDNEGLEINGMERETGKGLPRFKPGQHLVFHRPATSNQSADRRCYSLSSAPDDPIWRITVKDALAVQPSKSSPTIQPKVLTNRVNDESVSNWIHRNAREGDCFFVSGPQGRFTLDLACDKRPVLFIAAGVGITPMASMIHHELQFSRAREKWLFYQVADLDNAPLLAELAKRIEASQGIRGVIACSRDKRLPEETTFDRTKSLHITGGKLQPARMIASVGTTEVTILMCGPTPWMESMKAGFVSAGVSPEYVHYESFGQASSAIKDETQPATNHSDSSDSSAGKPKIAYQVDFEVSRTSSVFNGSKPDLLSHAKSAGVDIPTGCRMGNCGSCVVKLLKGSINYTSPPEYSVESGEILPCVCTPATDLVIQA